MNHSIRLSRISHPRASLWAFALVAVVFLAFGVWAELFAPLAESEPTSATQHAAVQIGQWVGGVRH